jgi:3-deoxy-D-manno-octulosonic-acid transferase
MMGSLPRTAYTLLAYALSPYALGHLLWRARKQPDYLRHIPERFGRYRNAPRRRVIWIHAVSVGETRASAPLVHRLKQTYPEYDILLSHMTPTGRETGATLFGDKVLRCYLPYDLPFAVNRFLDHFQPVLGLLMETELWCNLIHACHSRQIPLMLINARLSEKSAAGYRRLGALIGDALNRLSGVAAQSAADAERLEALGARDVRVTGNLKFDIAPPEPMLALGRVFRQRFGQTRPVWVAASTRDGEEAIVLDALRELQVPDLLLAIVPRHPQRFEAVAALLKSRGIRFQRRSEDAPVERETAVLLGDSMGEMFAYYYASDLALIGGSLLPYGGQNLIEACAAGTPVIIGPHSFNFSEATQLAVAAGAAIQLSENKRLGLEVQRLLTDTAKREEMSQRALAFSRAHSGAVERVFALIQEKFPVDRKESIC